VIFRYSQKYHDILQFMRSRNLLCCIYNYDICCHLEHNTC